ncbi:MAG: hypothetical protein JW967_04180 [Dehalococcoidales bacterium]|nr:hypothetical protein [Dehalococcoidales bacterium]
MNKQTQNLKILGVCTALAVFSLSLACCFASVQYIRNGCLWWECAPDRDFHVQDWEIPESVLPEGASFEHISSLSEGHGEIENGGQDIHYGYDIVIYIVYRFPSNKGAILEFERTKKGMFDNFTGETWQPPAELTFSSPTADQQHIACGVWAGLDRCKAVARYQEYVIFLNADMTETMTLAQFEQIYAYLDGQLSTRLYR